MPSLVEVDDGKQAAHDAQLGTQGGLTGAGQAKPRARPARAGVLGRFDEAGADENVEVPAEVAIRQVEPSLQVGELGTAGFGPRALELRVTAERTRDLRITSWFPACMMR